MTQITSTRRSDRIALGPLVGGTLVGAILVMGGLAIAYLAFFTPILSLVLPEADASGGQVAAAMAMVAALLVVPGVCVLVGTTRLARMVASVRTHVRWRSPVTSAINALPDEMAIAHDVTLPDGRMVSDLIVGPFGAAVIRELPPAGATRIRDGRWQARTRRGWIMLDDPLDRAARDAERVRRWLGDGDADFVMKVYAAVVGPSATIPRTAACAVVTPDQLAGWLAGLPPQRSLTPSRRERVLELIRDAG